jgi:hypothetical protein
MIRMSDDSSDRFLEQTRTKRTRLTRELWQMLREHRAYWLAPIVIMLLLLGALSLLASSAVGPFIYTLF